MKKTISLILSVIMLAMIAVPASAQTENELVLAENGSSGYRIVIRENSLPAERTAAQTFADYFERICSVRLPVVADTEEPSDKEIVIGVTARDAETDIDRSGYGADGVRIFTLGEKLFLTGGEARGSVYAVYTFLEDYLGCRWFTKTLTVVPEADRVAIPADTDYTFVPPFSLRQTYWSFSTAYSDFCAAHKLHGVMAYMSEEYGGAAAEYCVNSVHTLQWIITADMFGEHPEYFGCDENGNRSVNRQPCFSNDDVLEITTRYALNFFSQYNTILSISQNDGRQFCRCDKCEAYKKAHGNVDSACLINFVNKVAERVKQQYPGARLETLAYQDSLTPPENLSVADNVVIRLCPVNACVLHDFDDRHCEKNRTFDKALKGWAKLTDNIYMWNYSTNFQYYYALFPNITTLQARYRYFRDNNVVAVFDNGCGENMVPAEFHELKTYLVLKLLWDPDTDVERHISEFCSAYYGAAGSDIDEFIHTFEKDVNGYNPLIVSTVHMTCQDGGESLENNSALTECEIRALDKIMARAESREMSEAEANRLRGVSLSWRFFKCGTFAGEFNWFSPRHDPAEEAEKLYLDMKDYGIEIISEGGGIRFTDAEPDFTVRPTWWFADKDSMPSSVRIQSRILPVVNKIMRTVFWFIR